VHGAAAHSGWWVRVAPRLTGRRVVVLDLSGHGDSGHRKDYDGSQWAAEVAAVIGLTSDGPAVVVGHSMGGLVALATAARTPELVSSVVLVDTRLPLTRPLGLPSQTAPPRLYATPDEALDRFRLLPPETTADPALLRQVARAGLVAVDGGWRWKYHPRARHRFTNETVLADIAAVRSGVGYAYGARSGLGGPAALAYLEGALGRPVVAREVAGAFHHVPLDQPQACADAVQALIAELEREEPVRTA
jgi:pimeloyl-ACP methyl ester carboxylesterase